MPKILLLLSGEVGIMGPVVARRAVRGTGSLASSRSIPFAVGMMSLGLWVVLKPRTHIS